MKSSVYAFKFEFRWKITYLGQFSATKYFEIVDIKLPTSVLSTNGF